MFRSKSFSFSSNPSPAFRFKSSLHSGLFTSIGAVLLSFLFFTIFFFSSCSNTKPQSPTIDSTPTPTAEVIDTIFNNGIVAHDSVPIPTKHTMIGNTGLSIELPVTHKIEEQKGADFMVYYFSPVDTSVYHGEGGIYFGPRPDKHPPTTDYSQKTITGNFLGIKTKWTEYTTASYMQTETFIDNPDPTQAGQKIHVWFYANNPEEMARLLVMIRTIRK